MVAIEELAVGMLDVEEKAEVAAVHVEPHELARHVRRADLAHEVPRQVLAHHRCRLLAVQLIFFKARGTARD
jgi:hypothetical protein